MSVQFFKGEGALAFNLPAVAQKLDELMLAAGWTLDYSSNGTVWDAPTSTGETYRRIYKMNDTQTTSPWHVVISWYTWGYTNPTSYTFKSRIWTGPTYTSGTDVDNPGTMHYLTPGFTMYVSDTSGKWFVGAYESGFYWAMVPNSNLATWMHFVERARDFNGNLLDEIHVGSISSTNNTTYTNDGWYASSTYDPYGVTRARQYQVGGGIEYTPKNFLILGNLYSSVCPSVSMVRPNGLSSVTCGPMFASGYITGPPRLFTYMPPSDATPDAIISIVQDGYARNFYATYPKGGTYEWTSGQRICLAME